MPVDETVLYQRLVQVLGLPGKLDELIIVLGLDDANLTENAAKPAVARQIINQMKARIPPELDRLAKEIGLNVDPAPAPVPSPVEPMLVQIPPLVGQATILMLAANPVETTRLAIEKEAELIGSSLIQGGQSNRYKIQIIRTTTADELSTHFLQHKPEIVHFSGHGSPDGELMLEDAKRKLHRVRPEALERLFDALPNKPRCVVLNACYSQILADKLRDHVDCVIGMAREIGDLAALRFAEGFYRGLGFGKDYATAFKLGCAQVDLENLPDAVVPRINTERDGSDMPDEATMRSWVECQEALQPEDRGSRIYRVWFGTNRRPLNRDDPSAGFSAEDARKLHYGFCDVEIPKWHTIGSVGSGWFKRFVTGRDDRLKLNSLEILEDQDFWISVKLALAPEQPGERTAIVFLHGYNVSFEAAALRAAQIGFDLNGLGLMAFYSWPSKASYLGYLADGVTIEASEKHITQFLTEFARDSSADKIHVIAHSMGNRGLLRSVQQIVANAAATVSFGQVILAAPDVDVRVFEDLAKDCPALAQRTTLYASSKDLALASSGILYNDDRAGYVPPVTTVAGIDTIEVSNVDLTFLGHGYYAAARDLLHDIHRLLLHNDDPDKRLGLKRKTSKQGMPYWVIGA